MSIAIAASSLRSIKHTDPLLTQSSFIIKIVREMCSTYLKECATAFQKGNPLRYSISEYRYLWVQLAREGGQEDEVLALRPYSCALSDTIASSIHLNAICETMLLMISIIRGKEGLKKFYIKATHDSTDYLWELSYIQLTQLFASLLHLLRDYVNLHLGILGPNHPNRDWRLLLEIINDYLPTCFYHYRSLNSPSVSIRSLFDITLNSLFSDRYKNHLVSAKSGEASLVEFQVMQLMSVEPRMMQRRYGRKELTAKANGFNSVPVIILQNCKRSLWRGELDLLPLVSLIPEYEEKVHKILQEVMFKKTTR
ncbi:hypothetical protein CLAVI_000308 [Candidatus Clavichlamydia salmonicola]|uniref:hypothetical protein n=1 Tax=Candidatus Clavichlamydia salmonicola TaxID=469812 RepID=UPI001891523B|nr:hypothetical protein [Candidatus Clavichlamydia salmonicola]MBF5050693.1 hypothetical protein [Candidatus Clavichlamydia salmonicola]